MPDEQNASGRGLKLHHLRPAPGAHKAKTRVGRGEASKSDDMTYTGVVDHVG